MLTSRWAFALLELGAEMAASLCKRSTRVDLVYKFVHLDQVVTSLRPLNSGVGGTSGQFFWEQNHLGFFGQIFKTFAFRCLSYGIVSSGILIMELGILRNLTTSLRVIESSSTLTN